MGCFIFLFALISARLAIILTWLFSNVLERAYDGWLVPVLGFLFLPWTMLAYAWMYDSGRAVEGLEWFLVGFAFLIDLGSYASGRGARRPDVRPARRRPDRGRRARRRRRGDHRRRPRARRRAERADRLDRRPAHQPGGAARRAPAGSRRTAAPRATARCATASARTTASTSRSPPPRARSPHLNPGACFVSRLGHEPRVALAVLEAMLPPSVDLRLEHAPVAAETEGDRVAAVTLRAAARTPWWSPTGSSTRPRPGTCSRSAGAEHVTGFESQARPASRTRRPRHQPDNLQPVTVCFAVDHLAGEDHTIPRPARYAEFAPRFSWLAPDPRTNRPVKRWLAPNPDEDPLAIGPDFDDPDLDKDLWRFRRIAARGLFAPGAYRVRHHARQLAAGRLPGRGRARRAAPRAPAS